MGEAEPDIELRTTLVKERCGGGASKEIKSDGDFFSPPSVSSDLGVFQLEDKRRERRDWR